MSLKVTIRAEQRLDVSGKLITENVPLYADVNFKGRSPKSISIVLYNISDFDVGAQKMNPGTKARMGNFDISAAKVNSIIDELKGKYFSTYLEFYKSGQVFNAFDITDKVHPNSRNRKSSKANGNDISIEIDKLTAASDIIENTALSLLAAKEIKPKRRDEYFYFAGIIKRYEDVYEKVYPIRNLKVEHIHHIKDFILNEHEISKQFPDIYKGLNKIRKRGQGSVSVMLSTLKSVLKENKLPNPFSDEQRSIKGMLNNYLDEPFFLLIDELLDCIQCDYPSDLKCFRDAFLINCSLGLRYGDFMKVCEEPILYRSGIPYIKYAASKTIAGKKYIETIEQPIVKYAMDIINENGGNFPFIGDRKVPNTLAKYNKAIRRLFKHWSMDRPIIKRDDDGNIYYVEMYHQASTHTSRKTFVDIITKSQLNPYLAGVHKEGSAAVKRYTDLSLEDKYKLYSMAFRQPI